MFVPLFFRLHIFVKSYYICPPLSYLLSVSLRILPSRSIQVASKISFFFMVNILLHIPTMSSLFIYQWTLRLSPYLGYWKGCHNEHRGAYVFAFFWKIPRHKTFRSVYCVLRAAFSALYKSTLRPDWLQALLSFSTLFNPIPTPPKRVVSTKWEGQSLLSWTDCLNMER